MPCAACYGRRKKLPEYEALELTYNAIIRGRAGVDMGRNIFQSEAPVAMIQAVRAIVHDNATPKKAYELYLSLKKSNEDRQAGKGERHNCKR